MTGTADTITGAYRWPLSPEPEVLGVFRAPGAIWGPGHRGVDLAAVEGAEVLAAADGVVAFAGRVVDRSVVSIDHPDGLRTTYEPVSPTVRAGQSVRAGEVIGHVAAGDAGPHCAPAWCLHWGARVGRDAYVDPLTLLDEAPVIRLYPMSGRPATGFPTRGPPRTGR